MARALRSRQKVPAPPPPPRALTPTRSQETRTNAKKLPKHVNISEKKSLRGKKWRIIRYALVFYVPFFPRAFHIFRLSVVISILIRLPCSVFMNTTAYEFTGGGGGGPWVSGPRRAASRSLSPQQQLRVPAASPGVVPAQRLAGR